jgi:hypothetical protein
MSDEMAWLRSMLQGFEDKEEHERAFRCERNSFLQTFASTSVAGEKWRAEIKLLEDIGYNGRELDLEDVEDYDILKRRVELLRAALDG